MASVQHKPSDQTILTKLMTDTSSHEQKSSPNRPNQISTYNQHLIIEKKGITSYADSLSAMQTEAEKSQTEIDQIWLLQHHAIYTRGKLSKPDEISGNLKHPIIDTDRGGKITYHDTGQLICYMMIQLPSFQAISSLVNRIDKIIIDCLRSFGITAQTNRKNRGIYVKNRKIASLGLRVKNQRTYHGFSINVNTDLSAFTAIKPCGLDQEMTQVVDFEPRASMIQVMDQCILSIKKYWPPCDIIIKDNDPH